MASPLSEEIQRAHQGALERGATSYLDPVTGYTVFTELAHLRRGSCCGSACRHCPYGHAAVPTTR